MLILCHEGYASGLAPCWQPNCAVFLNVQSVLSTDILAFLLCVGHTGVLTPCQLVS